MARVRLSLAARADLRAIWRHVADDNPDDADRLVRTIRERVAVLARHALMGPLRPDVAPDVRMLVVGSHLVLYRVVSEEVEIVRVLHGARRPPEGL